MKTRLYVLATTALISAISVAHANDVLNERQMDQVTAGDVVTFIDGVVTINGVAVNPSDIVAINSGSVSIFGTSGIITITIDPNVIPTMMTPAAK